MLQITGHRIDHLESGTDHRMVELSCILDNTLAWLNEKAAVSHSREHQNWGIRIVFTSWVGLKNLTNCFCAVVDAINTRDKITTVALHKNGILCPVIVLELYRPCLLELVVSRSFRIQDCAAKERLDTSSDWNLRCGTTIPSTHHIAVSAENFGQAAHDDIRVR